jgi:pimeloyl-ACP methyl ester carboxylesterase
MDCRSPRHRLWLHRLILPAALLIVWACPTAAGEVTMRSGFAITGRPLQVEGLSVSSVRAARGNTNVKHVWMIDDGMRRYFVPRFQVDQNAVDHSSLVPFEEYTLRHQKTGRSIGPSVVGSFVEVTPFDQFGRRRVTLAGSGSKDIPIQQAITKLRPDYVTVESTSHLWEHSLATSSIRPEVLESLLKQATDPDDPTKRLGVIRFFIDAGLYSSARTELDQMRSQFPDMQDRIEQTQQELAHYIALKALGEIRKRQAAGQHQLAFAFADGFPEEMISADLRREARDLADEYRRQFGQMQKAHMLLSLLEAELSDEQADQVRPLRSVISDQLTFDSLARLEPFLRAEQDDTLQADEKLALACSGWLLGAARADLSLPAAIRLWQMRFFVRQYLRSGSELDRREALRQLLEIDGATVETIAAMIPQLTPVVDEPPPPAGVPMSVELSSSNPEVPQVKYSVVLPLEYSPLRTYPMVVALRPQGSTREQELLWWAGSASSPGHAMKSGYIVIAPEYADADAREYTYSLYAHTAVVASIRDARKRFAVDSDRIFLGGHGMGGDAAFDIGMAHADLFAGVMPITGVCDKYCRWTWDNSRQIGWYVVSGERDRDTLEVNASVLNQMMKRGYNLVYAEYMDRGYESYFEELPRLFDWMSLQRRAPEQPKFDVDITRPTETHWYWLNVDGFPEQALQPVAWEKGAHPPKQKIQGTITPGNTIYVGSGGERATIRLSPELVDFANRVEVKIGGRSRMRDFVTPSVEALLEDLRERGDRQRLYWAKLEF